MSDSSTSESYTHATSVSNIPGLRPLRIPDHHIPLLDPSQSSEQQQPPPISIPILNPPSRSPNLDHHTDSSEFLYGQTHPGSLAFSDSGELLITLSAVFDSS
jgi:hypothetical protein